MRRFTYRGGGIIADTVPEIDGLVNNAGIVQTITTDFVTREKLSGMFDINACAPITLFESLIERWKIRGGSSVVFTSSIDNGELNVSTGNSMYCATKAAVSEYVRQSAMRFAGMNIRVNAVCPGMTETNLTLGNPVLTPKVLEEDAKKYPLKRYAKPEEIANGIAFLLSEASSYITGFNLVIDGGITLTH